MDYPKHCIGCRKENKCQQKQHMTANTEPINGFVDYEMVDYVCENCLILEHSHYPLDNAEVDSPAHCSICGIPLNCRLTDYGIEYVKESINDNNGCCRELWPILFADYLEDQRI